MRPNQPPLFDIIVDFICEKGMTFRELIDSEYNMSLTPVNDYNDLLYFNIVTLPNRQLIGCKITDNTLLSDISLTANLDDVIIENTTYETA